jgi:hypothetical protein
MGSATIERRPASQIKPTVKRTKELRDAAERVYRRYGTDLAAFRKDIQRELGKREG